MPGRHTGADPGASHVTVSGSRTDEQVPGNVEQERFAWL